jgi:hypothetical protein
MSYGVGDLEYLQLSVFPNYSLAPSLSNSAGFIRQRWARENANRNNRFLHSVAKICSHHPSPAPNPES